jgi:hypothetical protein
VSPRDAAGLSQDGMIYSPLSPPPPALLPPILPRGAREGGCKDLALTIFRVVCQVAPAPTPTNVALPRGGKPGRDPTVLGPSSLGGSEAGVKYQPLV